MLQVLKLAICPRVAVGYVQFWDKAHSLWVCIHTRTSIQTLQTWGDPRRGGEATSSFSSARHSQLCPSTTGKTPHRAGQKGHPDHPRQGQHVRVHHFTLRQRQPSKASAQCSLTDWIYKVTAWWVFFSLGGTEQTIHLVPHQNQLLLPKGAEGREVNFPGRQKG